MCRTCFLGLGSFHLFLDDPLLVRAAQTVSAVDLDYSGLEANMLTTREPLVEVSDGLQSVKHTPSFVDISTIFLC